MIPKSLSASSILVSEACMERWKAENFYKTPQQDSEPAGVGTSVHYALEHFVRDVYIEEKYGWDEIKHLNSYYQLGYIDTFGSTDFESDAYKDGASLVAKWYDYNRSGLTHKVLSCEVKESFNIPTSAGDIPFNYIWDRADQRDETTFEVVDYKSLRKPVSAEDLKRKIQPRAYALAAQIKWPEAKRIWVTFDMLRYEPVGIVFTRDDNIATYRYLKRAAERIIQTDEDKTTEKLNEECKWCIRKASCDTLMRANRGGTWHGITAEQAAAKKLEVSNQLQALKYADEELDKILEQEAEARDEHEFELDNGFKVFFTVRGTRKPNSNAIANIVGPEIAAKYVNFTMANIDKMLDSGELSPEIAAKVKAEITKNYSQPKVNVKHIGDFE
jgi:hypothetical protein